MSNLNDIFGKAKDGSAKTNWFKFPKEGGSLILGILPPYGSLRDSGRWNKYYAVHFGYRDTKGKIKTFQSCEKKNKDRMIEVSDPAAERITKLKVSLDQAKLENNKELVSKLEVALKNFSIDKKYYMNVIDLSGKIGVIGIPHRMMEALKTQIKALEAKGHEPVGMNGNYFVFTRTGYGNQTTHSVSVYQEEVVVNGESLSKDKKYTITNDIANRIKSEGADLGKLYVAPTQEDIAAIVKGDASTLEAVLAKYKKSTPSEGGDEGSDEGGGDEDSYVTTPTSQSAAPAQEAAPVQTMTTPVKETAPAAPVAPPPTTLSGTDITNMSNEDFLKSMGL